MNTYTWKHNFTQPERQALIALFRINRNIGAVKVVQIAPGIDVVEEDGVTDASLEVLGIRSIDELKQIAANGVITDVGTPEVAEVRTEIPAEKAAPKKRTKKNA